MNLGFSEKFKDGKRTFFVAKVLHSLFRNEFLKTMPIGFYSQYATAYEQKFGEQFEGCNDFANIKPKLHTIRRDEKRRWRLGMLIHFVVNNRTANRFQFAPVVPVKCIQEIEIKYIESTHYKINIGVFVDGEMIGNAFGNDEIEAYDNTLYDLAVNDGFDSVQSFFGWFSEDFKGRLIHWTDLYY